jgi:hypothetical protein
LVYETHSRESEKDKKLERDVKQVSEEKCILENILFSFIRLYSSLDCLVIHISDTTLRVIRDCICSFPEYVRHARQQNFICPRLLLRAIPLRNIYCIQRIGAHDLFCSVTRSWHFPKGANLQNTVGDI